MLDGIDRALEDHRRLSARVAFDRLFAGWDTRWNEAFAEWWATNCPDGELWLFGVQTVAPRPWACRMEVVEPPFELTFTMTDGNLDAAAYQEAYQGGPTLIFAPIAARTSRGPSATSSRTRCPDVSVSTWAGVEFHLDRLGLPSIYHPEFPGTEQETLVGRRPRRDTPLASAEKVDEPGYTSLSVGHRTGRGNRSGSTNGSL